MSNRHKVLATVMLAVSAYVMNPETVRSQQADEQTCSATLTEQLRRFSEKCISDLVAFVASQPKMAAKIYSEKEKYYLILTRADDGVLAEAVGKFNYPLMKPDTPDALKRMGWAPPENEADHWTMKISQDAIKDGGAARRLSDALRAYGLAPGEALSLTVGPEISDKPVKG